MRTGTCFGVVLMVVGLASCRSSQDSDTSTGAGGSPSESGGSTAQNKGGASTGGSSSRAASGTTLSGKTATGGQAIGGEGGEAQGGAGGDNDPPDTTAGGAPKTSKTSKTSPSVGGKSSGGGSAAGGSSAKSGTAKAGGASGTAQGSGGKGSGGKAAGGGPGSSSGGISLGGNTTKAEGGSATGGTTVLGTRAACQPPLSYRNLFAEVLSKTDEEIDVKLTAGYKQLFHGGSNETLYYESGSGAYILDVNNNDVRSEGMSYGMMISVQMDKKDEFNKLWTWAKQKMRQPSGMFGWQANADGSLRSTGSAPDGEEYIAAALIFAGKRWNDNTLLTEGKNVLSAMLTNGAFDQGNKLVKFLTNVNYTDPSYMLPAFYETWACVDTANQSFWKGAATAARSFFQKTCNAQTGLAPYLAEYSGGGHGSDGYFQSDPWRVVGNIMMDYHFFGVDPWQSKFAATYSAFWRVQQAKSPMPDELDLNGTVRKTHADPAKALIAQNALVGFGIPKADAEFFVQALWDMKIPSGQYRYYDGLLYMLSFLHASGRFHLYY